MRELRVIRDFPSYAIRDDGIVVRIATGKGTHVGLELKGTVNRKDGYLSVQLYRDGRSKRILVHKLVAEAFIGPRPPGLVVNHKDLDRQNNQATNLEYVTQAENQRHAVAMGGGAVGERNGRAKFTDVTVAAIRAACAEGESQAAVARRFGVSATHVGYIANGRSRRRAA